jgi:hypothetical protein
MSEKVSVKPAPIQRNPLDVAMELLNLHNSKVSVEASELSELYAKYYTLAYTLSRKSPSELNDFLPEEIKGKISKTSNW